jgi:hypothetical protein
MNIRTALIAYPQPTVLRQPRQGPLDHPSIDTQTAAMCLPAFRQHRRDAHGSQCPAMGLRIIAPIALYTLGTASRRPRLPADRGDCCQQRQQLGDIMPMGARHHSGQGNPVRIREEMMFTARLAPIGGIGAGFFPHHPQHGRSGYRQQRVPSRSYRPHGAWPITRYAVGARPRRDANPAGGASTSCRSHTPSPGAAVPMGYRISAQKESPSTQRGLESVVSRPVVWTARAEIKER